ncbi:MAG TPA: 7-carboxy-7-deazaguanine synthase QueE [Methanosarcina sp.]|nr:7-carboxy-7-deazaguanine synthase QueE [Methanosarcina sp.]
MSKIRLAQKPFLSVQGEGPRTGKLTVFVRFFGCNLRCGGFFQKDPTKPETYIKPVLADPKSFKTLNDFPVVEYGCDTLYAIDPKYKHLAIDYDSAEELVREIESLLPKIKHGKNAGKPSWVHPTTWNEYDICFTGGEPLMQQDHINEIVQLLASKHQDETRPAVYQFETNGTRVIEDVLAKTIKQYGPKTLFNISPKLFTVTGEPSEKAWFPENIVKFQEIGDVALKFVVNDTEAAFNELNDKVCELHQTVPVYIMPVGSSYEQQSDYKIINKIASMALERGYHISGRLHCLLFGNDAER